jgi:hypothetical protein
MSLLGYEEGTIRLKILLTSWVVKGEFASPNCPYFPAKIDDFGLKRCILKGNAKNHITAGNIQFGALPIPSPKASVGLKIHGFTIQRLKLSINNSWGLSLHLL